MIAMRLEHLGEVAEARLWRGRLNHDSPSLAHDQAAPMMDFGGSSAATLVATAVASAALFPSRHTASVPGTTPRTG